MTGRLRGSRSGSSKPPPCCGDCRHRASSWPTMFVEFSDLVGQTPEPMRLPPPSPAAIDRMETTLGWMPWLEPVDAKIAWLRASGTRWKEICWEVGLARAAAHEHWLYALCVIAWRLNGRDRVKHIGRRRLIARVRSLGAVRKTSLADTFRADAFTEGH